MNNFNNNFKKNKKYSHPSNTKNTFKNTNSNNEPQHNTTSDNRKIFQKPKSNKRKIHKPTLIFGCFCIAVFTGLLLLSPNSKVDSSIDAKQVLSTQYSTTLSAGTILLETDENIEQKDYTITHNSEDKETKIWVWDYAAEDGDYVQILVNGTPLSDSFMIKHKPKEFIVPCVGDVQVKGIKDGGGGITYAIRYNVNGTNYFNSAPKDEYNTYTLVKE